MFIHAGRTFIHTYIKATHVTPTPAKRCSTYPIRCVQYKDRTSKGVTKREMKSNDDNTGMIIANDTAGNKSILFVPKKLN